MTAKSTASTPSTARTTHVPRRGAARIRHPNVFVVLDVVHDDGELLLAMEYGLDEETP